MAQPLDIRKRTVSTIFHDWLRWVVPFAEETSRWPAATPITLRWRAAGAT